ncbi:trypsin-like peptidase domain-containing protein [Streptomyces iakyrus]|uniref:trypsin-like peptidase domain-containing protein n=1 Tax=Streptomyces iakyrus TaxID=68219 RepID=UPI0036EE364D
MAEALISLLKTVTVRVESGKSTSGTGFFIAPGTVLTAAHVATEQTCTVHWRTHTLPGTVLWRMPDRQRDRGGHHPLPDLAAIRLDDPPGHPFAELDDDEAWDGAPTSLLTIGYSRKYEHESWQPEECRHETFGPLLIHGTPLLRLGDAQLTAGMSGSPVLNLRTGRVCAVVKRSAPDDGDGGWAVLLSPHLQDRTSPLAASSARSELWRDARRRTLFPELGELLRVVTGDPDPQFQAHGLALVLHPKSAVVRFHGRDEWRERLAEWCDGDEAFSLKLITGQGGCGKTRLALDLAAERHRRGWISGFLGKKALQRVGGRLTEHVRKLATLGESVLLVIDYAEGVENLDELLELLAGYFPISPRPPGAATDGSTGGPRLRILMLARHDGSWWSHILPELLSSPALIGKVTRRDAVAPLNELADDTDGWHDEFRLALRAFARDRSCPVPEHAELEIPPGDTPPVLQVHAAALVAVLQAQENPTGEQRVTVGEEVINELLRRERNYWKISAAVRAVPLQDYERPLAVAHSVLLGADDREEGAQLLRVGLGLSDLAGAEVAKWLAALYPGDTSDVSRYWAPLRPDLVGEQLVACEFDGKIELVNRLLGVLPETRSRHMFTVLARAAQHHKEAHTLVQRVLRDRPLDHLPLAIRLAPYAGNRLGLIIREVLDELDELESVDETLLGVVLDALPAGPGDSVELASTWTFLLERIDPDFLTPQMLMEQGQSFLTVGDTRQAVPVLRRAVEGCEQHLRGHPEDSQEELSLACATLGSALAQHGQQKEAEALCRRAVELSEQAGRVSLAQVSALLASIDALLGAFRWDEAERLAERVLDLLPEMRDGGTNEARHALVLTVMAQIHLARGWVGRARATADAAYRALPPSVLNDLDLYGSEIARVCGVRALAALCTGPEDEAEQLAREALRLLNWLHEHDVRSENPLLALLLVVLAHQAHAAGDTSRARALSRRAADLAAERMEAGNQRVQIVLAQALRALSRTGGSVPASLGALVPRVDPEFGPAPDDPIGRMARQSHRMLGRESSELIAELHDLCAQAQHLADHDRAAAVDRGREALRLLAAEGDLADGPLPSDTAELLAGLTRWTEPAPDSPAEAWHESRGHARQCVILRRHIADADPSAGPVTALLEERIQLARTEQGAGNAPEAEHILDSATHDAAMAIDPRPPALTEALLRALLTQVAILERLGRTHAALSAAERFRAYHRQDPDALRRLNPALLGASLVRHTRLLTVVGRGTEAAGLLEQDLTREYFPPNGSGIPAVHAVEPMLHLVSLNLALGRVEQAHDSAIRAEQVCRSLSDRPDLLVTALRQRGQVLRSRGLAEAALLPLGEALDVARRTPATAAQVADTLADLASALTDAGQPRAALKHLDSLVAHHASPDREGRWRVQRAHAHSALGDWDEAVRDCERAEFLYGSCGDRRGLRDALSRLAYHLLGAGRDAEALRAADAAEAEARPLARGGGAEDVRRQWETLLIRAAVLRATGASADREEAEAAALLEHHKLTAGSFPALLGTAVQAHGAAREARARGRPDA